MAFSNGAMLSTADWPFISQFQAHFPDKDKQLTKKYGNQTLYGLLDYVGAKKSTGSLQYSHFEEDWIMPKVKVAANGAGGANAAVTFTLQANSQFTLDPALVDISPYNTTATKKFNPMQVGMIIMVRPFGVSVLMAGIDSDGPKLFQTDPTGIYWQYYAVAIGEGEDAIEAVLHKKYKQTMTIQEGLKLCLTTRIEKI